MFNDPEALLTPLSILVHVTRDIMTFQCVPECSSILTSMYINIHNIPDIPNCEITCRHLPQEEGIVLNCNVTVGNGFEFCICQCE